MLNCRSPLLCPFSTHTEPCLHQSTVKLSSQVGVVFLPDFYFHDHCFPPALVKIFSICIGATRLACWICAVSCSCSSNCWLNSRSCNCCRDVNLSSSRRSWSSFSQSCRLNSLVPRPSRLQIKLLGSVWIGAAKVVKLQGQSAQKRAPTHENYVCATNKWSNNVIVLCSIHLVVWRRFVRVIFEEF